MGGTSGPQTVSTKLRRIATLASDHPAMVLTTLAHHIDRDWLFEAYQRTRKDGAVGVDGQTARRYTEKLQDNLQTLHEAFKSGTYRAPPVKRAYIPKGGGKQRPIGIPTFEDKVLQRAVAMVLEAVYEQDFRDCSYGFRPGRSPQQALRALKGGLRKFRGGWVIDLDIKGFFDHLDHGHLRDMLDRRVRDGVIRRTIDKWLKAGVLEAGGVSRSSVGTPQGGVISPLLANVYLHHVLDVWFEDTVVPRLDGGAFMVRYADDAVLVCKHRQDAERVMEVLDKRLERFGLELHPDKTRLVGFCHPLDHDDDEDDDGGRESTFDFLGFTHMWAKSWKDKEWYVKQRVAGSRLRRMLKSTYQWCKWNRHQPVSTQHRRLVAKLRGYDAYFGLPGNYQALDKLRREVKMMWYKWLNRRSQGRHLNWEEFERLLEHYPLPPPRIYRRPAYTAAKL